LIERLLWQQAEQRLTELEAAGEQPLCVWDGSVLEKPESAKLEGLAPVRSSKAKRLQRSRAFCLQQAGASDCGTRLGVERRALVWLERGGAGGKYALVESQR
jgi:hypothetical protein